MQSYFDTITYFKYKANSLSQQWVFTLKSLSRHTPSRTFKSEG